MQAAREGRTGRVLHIYRSLFAFLHDREIVENGGVFVAYTRYITAVAPKGTKPVTPGPDLTKMNPIMSGVMAPPPIPQNGHANSRQRDPIENLREVVITKGPYKGHKGNIKDVNGPLVRIELQTSSKLITVERERLFKEKYVQVFEVNSRVLSLFGLRIVDQVNQYPLTNTSKSYNVH